MPIYAYKCSACGHAQDILQKMSDPLLTVCPECGQSTYAKQVTAAGFQLKGSGWYVTDFRNNGSAAASAPASTAAPASSGAGASTAGGNAPASAASGSTSASTPASAPAAAPTGTASS